ncbi:hypothetical protein K470DRAFT_260545 [Piedraia hortae CBS 480.64]|uniref:Uncharacterized protein n=1 Tax=Piedraia hortae CBS 480.64 TaxID=1314780 RepID=A0A6A7BR83_9PEZI|nr:hypothetical protein K470DRAFT_260545 [Piedraia hortae CBS 480.64]
MPLSTHNLGSKVKRTPAWNHCMDKSYCKWLALVSILVACLIVLGMIICLSLALSNGKWECRSTKRNRENRLNRSKADSEASPFSNPTGQSDAASSQGRYATSSPSPSAMGLLQRGNDAQGQIATPSPALDPQRQYAPSPIPTTQVPFQSQYAAPPLGPIHDQHAPPSPSPSPITFQGPNTPVPFQVHYTPPPPVEQHTYPPPHAL